MKKSAAYELGEKSAASLDLGAVKTRLKKDFNRMLDNKKLTGSVIGAIGGGGLGALSTALGYDKDEDKKRPWARNIAIGSGLLGTIGYGTGPSAHKALQGVLSRKVHGATLDSLRAAYDHLTDKADLAIPHFAENVPKLRAREKFLKTPEGKQLIKRRSELYRQMSELKSEPVRKLLAQLFKS